MGILQTILLELEDADNLQKIRELCFQIFEEEKEKQKYLGKHPKGSNLFLTLEVPNPSVEEKLFLGLERENEDTYLSILYKCNNIEDDEPRYLKSKVWEIRDHRPEKILTEFAKKYKEVGGKL